VGVDDVNLVRGQIRPRQARRGCTRPAARGSGST
jgi:hypothetical protein